MSGSRSGGRFTAWFSPIERRALEVAAERENGTLNFIVRKAVRQYLGKEALKKAAEDVMVVTGNQP